MYAMRTLKVPRQLQMGKIGPNRPNPKHFQTGKDQARLPSPRATFPNENAADQIGLNPGNISKHRKIKQIAQTPGNIYKPKKTPQNQYLLYEWFWYTQIMMQTGSMEVLHSAEGLLVQSMAGDWSTYGDIRMLNPLIMFN